MQDLVMYERDLPSNNFNSIAGIETTDKWLLCMIDGSMKQCVEPQLIRMLNGSETRDEVIEIIREFRSERADALRWNSGAQEESMQSPECAEYGGLPVIFLFPLPENQQKN